MSEEGKEVLAQSVSIMDEITKNVEVVADEVRQLAARTSTSTSEISKVVKKNTALSTALSKNIIETQSKAQSGRELISQVEGVFVEIN